MGGAGERRSATDVVVILEGYAVLPILAAARAIRAARAVYLHRDFPPSSHLVPRHRLLERFAVALLRWINPRAATTAIEEQRLNDHACLAAKDTVASIDAIEPVIAASVPCQVVIDLLGDANVVKYFKYLLARGWAPNWLLFEREAADFAQPGRRVVVVPRRHDGLLPSRDGDVPAAVTATLRVFDRGRRVREAVLFLLFPVAYIARELARGRLVLRNPTPIRRQVLQTVNWGVGEDTLSGGVRRGMSDQMWLGDETQERTVFLLSRGRRYTPEMKARCEADIRDAGIPHVDGARLSLTPRVLGELLRLQARLWRVAWRRWSSACPDPVLWTIGYNALYHACEKIRELAWVDHKVEFCLNDGSDAHIIRTVVSNSRGIRTIGVQHNSNAGPYIWPQLCYVHFNRYCVYSDAHVALHAPHWQRLPLVRTGRIQVDWLMAMASAPQVVDSLRQRLQAAGHRRRHLAVIAVPGPGAHNMRSRWDELYAGLEAVLSTTVDCTIWIRVREQAHLQHPVIGRFRHLMHDSRVVIDSTTFSTYELMVLCDLFLSNSHSSALLEAVAIGRRAFTFDLVGTGKLCFSRYGRDLVLSTRDDVARVFGQLDDPAVTIDCDWDRLRGDYHYFTDGGSLRRIRDAIGATLAETIDHNVGEVSLNPAIVRT